MSLEPSGLHTFTYMTQQLQAQRVVEELAFLTKTPPAIFISILMTTVIWAILTHRLQWFLLRQTLRQLRLKQVLIISLTLQSIRLVNKQSDLQKLWPLTALQAFLLCLEQGKSGNQITFSPSGFKYLVAYFQTQLFYQIWLHSGCQWSWVHDELYIGPCQWLSLHCFHCIG